MSNIKAVNIVADVPFNWLDSGMAGVSLPEADVAAVAGALLSPSIGLEYSYQGLGYVLNDRGGQTAMYRLSIWGEEALSTVFLSRLARILKAAGPLAKLHVAEARDIENDGGWELLVAPGELNKPRSAS